MSDQTIEMSYSFLHLLSEKLPLFEGNEAISKVEIPKIQRNYVQGAQTVNDYTMEKELNSKGARFLNVLFEKLMNADSSELQLDFIYGSVVPDGMGNFKFLPLDGQQRLTTLFLLHWYIGRKENIWESKDLGRSLSKFTYETRMSTRKFCELLCGSCTFSLESERKPSEIIRNCNWYYMLFDNDPSVMAMLNMLDEIHIRYENNKCSDLFSNLERLKFYILPLNRFNLSEELYVKMNARGKQLTDFENFKADLVRWMKNDSTPVGVEFTGDRPNYLYISTQIDINWSEYVWQYYDKKAPDNLLYKAVCRWLLNEYILSWTESGEMLSKDETYKLLEKEGEYTSFSAFQKAFESRHDLINRLDRFLTTYCSEPDIEMIIQPSWGYGDTFSPFSDKFGQRERVVLCAMQLYLEEQDFNKEVSKERFKQWMRIAWNIAENTDITDAAAMIGLIKNTINELSKGAGSIIDFLTESDIRTAAARKEAKKARFILNDPEWEETFIEAEKHPYFHGSIDFLIDDTMTIDSFKHRFEMAKLIFDDKGFSYKLAKEEHIIIRAVISNIKTFASLIGPSEWIGKNYPDKDEREHYLKKYLSAEEDATFAETVRGYCDCANRNALLEKLYADCGKSSEIYKTEINASAALDGEERTEALKIAEMHRRVHEALYISEELQNAIQSNNAWRISREWESKRYFASKPRTWYDWIVLDSNRSDWIDRFFEQNGFVLSETRGAISGFYWRKQVLFEGEALYTTGERLKTQIVIDANGTITVRNLHTNQEIPGLFENTNYHEMSPDDMEALLMDKIVNNRLPG